MLNKVKSRYSGKKFTFIIVLLQFIIVFTGCEKKPTESEPKEEEQITTEKGTENLGCGYDVFDKYADVSIVKARILDLNKLSNANLIEKKTIEKSVFTTSSGTTVNEYASSLQTQAELQGSFMFFSGAIRASFSESRYSRQEYSYATVHSAIQKLSFRIPMDVPTSDLKNYLTETAKNNINNSSYSPNSLFQTYGTHCMVGIIVGGRLDYNISAKSSDVTGSKSIGAYANFGFKTKFKSASISSETITDEQWNTFSNSKEERLETYGGKSEYGQNIINDGDYNNWINSIDENPVFCEFASNNSLVPIWELCDNAARKTEIQNVYNSWAEEKKIQQTSTPHYCIIDLNVKSANTWGELPDVLQENNLEYLKLGMDCNQGADGKYIAIYYALGLDDGTTQNKTPINGILFVDQGEGENCPGDYEALWGSERDLNRGAGGGFIYLAFKRGSDNPIRGIRLTNFTTGGIQTSQDVKSNAKFYDIMRQSNRNEKQDLNNKAGGDFIFMSYSYDNID